MLAAYKGSPISDANRGLMTVGLDLVRFAGRDVPIGSAGVVIGRERGCDLVIDGPTISRRHARVFNNPKGSWVEDLGSRNGTSVNGTNVDRQPVRLTSGDRIRVGDEVVIVLAGEETVYADPGTRSPKPTIHAGPTATQLAAKPLTVGRDPANVLKLDDPNISRFHAVIERRSGWVELRDLSSRNGTRVNGRSVSRIRLENGDQIAIGAYRFRFTGTALTPIDERRTIRVESLAVSVSVGSKQLLAPTSLTVEPGELVAIIGESGAGKTTLLKVLAGITNPTSGRVLVNAEPVVNRLTDIGYVPQDDIVHRLLTVGEAMWYAAKLRLPADTSADEINNGVTRVLAALDLNKQADLRVDRLSGGQRKRVGVAVELLSRPGILFLDEPATGLDPGLEKRLMALLRRLTRNGRPIVTITHSTAHLPICDKLIVMARGGVLRYCGPPAGALPRFGVNDYVDIYTALDAMPAPEPAHSSGPASAVSPSVRFAVGNARVARERQPTVIPQALVLARRYLTLTVRDRRNLIILLAQVPVLALVLAIGFKASIFSRAGGTTSAPTLLFMTAITAIWLGAFAATREIVKEKSVFVRERSVGVSVRAYLLSKVSVLFLICAAQILILAAILFGLRPLHAQDSVYAECVAILLLTSVAANAIGLLVSTLARSEDQAMSYIPLFLIPQLVFGGSIIPLVGKGIGFKVLAGAMLARWSFAGLGAANRLGRQPTVALHYGSLFSHSVLQLLVVLAVFPALTWSLVAVRLAAQRT
jgi:ABC-type multidrug transport system ATPase subunit